jgi:hypothetical protein
MLLFVFITFFAQLASSDKPVKVETLAVQITTRNLRGAGTDNAVYFDVGPWAWRLNSFSRNDFERGHTDTFDLKVPEGFDVNDIVWLRLHKKGLFGVTGMRDGFAGAWHPERITLFVNGIEYASTEVKQRLNSRYWFWTALKKIDPYADPLSFARSLRLKANERLPWFATATGFFTTPLLKKRGISGWINCPEQKENEGIDTCSHVPALVCASGSVFRAPAISTDGLATIDLTVKVLEFCATSHDCQQRADIFLDQTSTRHRYLRVEYRHRGKRIPKKDESVRACGNLLWDTDKEGWWEIHAGDVPVEVLSTTGQRSERQFR